MITIRVRGLAKLRALSKTLGQPQRLLELAAKDGAEELLNLTQEGFKAGTDPYGRAWNAPNSLQITGRLRAYTKSHDTSGFKVHSTDEKAIWHHAPQPRPAWGGKALPTRLQVPTKAQGLPSHWHDQLVEALEDAIANELRKAGLKVA